MRFRDPRFVIAYSIVVGFAAAYIYNPSETMNGALIAAFAGAWGFYLGSSSGAATARDQVGDLTGAVREMAKSVPNATDSGAIREGDNVTLEKQP